MATHDSNGKFAKGNKLGGRPAESLGRKNVKKIMNDEIDRISKMTFGMAVKELKEILKQKDELTAAAQLLLSQIQKGNLKALELLIDRVLGRPTQMTDLSIKEYKTVEEIIKDIKEGKKDEHVERSKNLVS